MIMAKDCKNVPKPHHYCMVMNWIFRLLFCTVFWCTKDKMTTLCITHQICDFHRKTSPHQQSKLRCRSMAEETTFGQRMLFSQIRCPNTNEHKIICSALTQKLLWYMKDKFNRNACMPGPHWRQWTFRILNNEGMCFNLWVCCYYIVVGQLCIQAPDFSAAVNCVHGRGNYNFQFEIIFTRSNPSLSNTQ